MEKYIPTVREQERKAEERDRNFIREDKGWDEPLEQKGIANMKHTPTPWKWTPELLDNRTHGPSILDAKLHTTICAMETVDGDAPDEQNDRIFANAEFIVRAVNAHEELLAAAKMALSFIANAPLYPINLDILNALKVAIAMAQGRGE